MISNGQYWSGVSSLLTLVGIVGSAVWLRGKRRATKLVEAKAVAAQMEEERDVDRRYRRELYRQETLREITLACYNERWSSRTESGSKTTDGKSSAGENIATVARNDTEAALDAALGTTASNGSRRVRRKAKMSSGPKFRRPSPKELCDPDCKHFHVIEEKSRTYLKADRSAWFGEQVWVFSVELPEFEALKEVWLPVAFAGMGAAWVQTVPFSTIPADAVERALAELEAWFLRVATGVEKAEAGRLAGSISRDDCYIEGPGYPDID